MQSTYLEVRVAQISVEADRVDFDLEEGDFADPHSQECHIRDPDFRLNMHGLRERDVGLRIDYLMTVYLWKES